MVHFLRIYNPAHRFQIGGSRLSAPGERGADVQGRSAAGIRLAVLGPYLGANLAHHFINGAA